MSGCSNLGEIKGFGYKGRFYPVEQGDKLSQLLFREDAKRIRQKESKRKRKIKNKRKNRKK
jgi:hypothetical protein